MNNTQLPVGWPLLKDDAAGDPASLGVAVLLANATTGDATYNGETYGAAAEAQLNFLLYDVPRVSSNFGQTRRFFAERSLSLSQTAQGAISHRVNEAQLWADNVYMVPPFLAYYGALTNNQTLLDLAYTQISLYRDALRHSDTNLWQHTVYGGVVDSGMWATGNAWVVAGCARVIATIQRSSFASSMSSQVADLQSWASEILGATEKYISSNGLLHNYVDNSSSFEDSTSSALMAAGGLRLSTLNLTNDYVNMSLTLLSGVSKKVNDTGYVTQVTDPYTFSKQGTESPEAQSFVILAYSAYNEWVAQGSNGIEKGKNPIGSSAASPRATAGMAGLLTLATALWVLA
jgi:rhamnogalacturonyl hydrolase YesR